MRKLKRIICILLSVALLFLCACSESAEETEQEEVNTVKYNTPAASVKKTETVYVNLDNTGAKKSIKVSDWLHVPQGGVYVDDVTNLNYQRKGRLKARSQRA